MQAKVKVSYRVSDEYVKQVTIETGEIPSQTTSIEGPLSDVSKEFRERIVDKPYYVESDATGHPAYRVYVLDAYHATVRAGDRTFELPFVNEPFVTIQQAVVWYFMVYLPAYKDAQNEARRIEEERLQKLRQEEEARRRFEVERNAQEAREREKFEQEMHRWIEERGSDRLKLAYKRGYNVVGLYVRERSAIEFPGFDADLKNNAEWKERVNPSQAGLDIETETIERARLAGFSDPDSSVYIVWLTRPVNEEVDEEYFTPREAVVVEGYLGRYFLVRVVN